MKLEINIPDELYNNMYLMSKSRLPGNALFDCIANGKPLPKGDGELIKALDKIRAEIEFEVDCRTNMLCAEDVFEIIDKYKSKSEE